MSHRVGHIDGTGDGNQSMNRRKYLNTLATGAAFSAVAAGLAACGSPSGSSEKQQSMDTAADAADPGQAAAKLQATATAAIGSTKKQWGYLSIFPPGILTLAEARANMPAPGSRLIRVPFFNNNGATLTEGSIVGFDMIRIGCPTLFVMAVNLVVDHDHPLTPEEREIYTRRNTNMDVILRSIGYSETDWVAPDGTECPDPPDDWGK